MSRCTRCGSAISFSAVLHSLNPIKVKCSGCRSVISFYKFSAVFFSLLLGLTVGFILVLFSGESNYWLTVALPAFVGFQVVYYCFIKLGLVRVRPEYG